MKVHNSYREIANELVFLKTIHGRTMANWFAIILNHQMRKKSREQIDSFLFFSFDYVDIDDERVRFSLLPNTEIYFRRNDDWTMVHFQHRHETSSGSGQFSIVLLRMTNSLRIMTKIRLFSFFLKRKTYLEKMLNKVITKKIDQNISSNFQWRWRWMNEKWISMINT